MALARPSVRFPPVRWAMFSLVVVLGAGACRASKKPPTAQASSPASQAITAPPPPPISSAPKVESGPDPRALTLFEKIQGDSAQPLSPQPEMTMLTRALGRFTVGWEQSGGIASTYAVVLNSQQHAAIALPADHCIAAAARGGLGVVEIDLFVTDGSSTVVQDLESGPIALVFHRTGDWLCLPVTGAAKLHVVVRRGAGEVVVQLHRFPG